MAAEVKISIKAINKTRRVFRVVSQQLKKMGSMALSAAKRIGMISLAAVGTAAAMVRVYTKQEDAELDLVAALRNRGDAYDELMPKLKAHASALQDQTRYGDEEILSQMAYARNLGVTADKLEDAASAAVGLAAAYRIDLKAAMMLIGRASVGQTSMLTRYGIVLGDTLTAEEKFNELLSIGRGKMNLAKEATNTTSGAFAQMRNRLGDMIEHFGGAIAKGFQLVDFFKKADAGIKAFISRLEASGVIERWAEKARDTFGDVLTIVEALSAGGARRQAAAEGLKKIGSDFAQSAAAKLLQYAPLIGDAIGRAAKAAFTGAAKSVRLTDMAAQQLRSRGQLSAMEANFPGITTAMSPEKGRLITEAKQSIHAQQLQAQGKDLAAAMVRGLGGNVVDAINQLGDKLHSQ